jgi:hypothetical protein
MWELIACVAVSWSSSCQQQPPVVYPSAYFCERAAAQVVKRKDVRQVYCRERR